MISPTTRPFDATRPTRVRYKVVGLAVLLAMVTYLDRVCISTLADDISRDLGLTQMQMSLVFSAFTLAYAAFEIPTAWWADRAGTRSVLTRIVLWWSTFTMATAAAFNYGSLLITRFLFGAGEAGAWPSVARTFSRWIPKSERGRVQGIFFMGAHLAGGITPSLVQSLSHHLPWRAIFALFGAIGFTWAMAWWLWFRDDPAEHPAVNRAELEMIVADRPPDAGHSAGWDYWRRLLCHRNTWALCLMYLPNTFAFYFCITWLPKYLKVQHGFTSVTLGIVAGLPLTLSVLGDLFGGVTTDWVTARYGLRIGRSGVGAAAYVLAGLSMLLAATTTQPLLAAVLISLAVAASMFTLAASWGTCLDVGGNHAGVVSAAMNTSGQIGGIACPIIVTFAVEHLGSWNASLYLIGGLFLFGAVCWGLVDPRRRIFDD
jgi:MFS family permease